MSVAFKFSNNKIALYVGMFLSGVLASVPYFVDDLFVLTFVSLFLFFVILKQFKHIQRRVFLPFFCYFSGFYLLLYSFLSELYPFERFGFTQAQATFVIICACILIPLLHASVFSLIMSISRIVNNDRFFPLVYSALWVLGEWVLSLGTLAFPWANTAVSMTGLLPYIQSAALFGTYFVTFVTVFGCAFIAECVYSKRVVSFVLGFSVILSNLLLGSILMVVSEKPSSDPVKVAVVQGNVLSNEKWVSGNSERIFETYIKLTEEAASNDADIILLPESAIPKNFYKDGSIHTELSKIAKKYSTTIILGIQSYENKALYNSAVAILPDGSLSQRYDKRHLVPFGEFVPFADTLGNLIPFVADMNENSIPFTEGTDSVVFETPNGTVSPLICFDSIFPEFASDAVNNDADILAIVTNDSWFNDSVGIYTHLRHAQLRAIENNRYVLRAANTGISAFIDSKGRIIVNTLPLTKDVIYADIYARNAKTLYTTIGDITLYASALIVTCLITTYIFQRLRRIKNGKNSTSSDGDL